MRAIVQKYIDEPSAALLNQLTTEEQRFVEKQEPAKPKKEKAAKAKKEKAKQPEADAPEEAAQEDDGSS